MWQCDTCHLEKHWLMYLSQCSVTKGSWGDLYWKSSFVTITQCTVTIYHFSSLFFQTLLTLWRISIPLSIILTPQLIQSRLLIISSIAVNPDYIIILVRISFVNLVDIGISYNRFHACHHYWMKMLHDKCEWLVIWCNSHRLTGRAVLLCLTIVQPNTTYVQKFTIVCLEKSYFNICDN